MKERRGRVATKQTFNFQFWQQIGRCGVCFSNMNLVAKGVHKYLACSNKRKGLCKASLNVRADIAEEVFRNILVKVGALGLIQTDAEALTDTITALDASIHAKQVVL